MEEPKEKRPLESIRFRCGDNIKMDHQEVGWGLDWFDLSHGSDSCRAVVSAVMKLRVA